MVRKSDVAQNLRAILPLDHFGGVSEQLVQVFLIGLLVVLWAIVFLPATLRAREASPLSSVGTFRRGMHALASGLTKPTGRWIVMPRRPVDHEQSRVRVLAQRRLIFEVLLGAVLLSAVAGLVPAWRAMWSVNLILDGFFGGYVVLLMRIKRSENEQAESEDEPADFDDASADSLDDEEYLRVEHF